jgi:Flp pilus assembly protein TadB
VVPQVPPTRCDREHEMLTTTRSESFSPTEERNPPATHDLVDAQPQAPEMAWTGMIMHGAALLLVSAGLGVAMALHINFAEWLFCGVLQVLVIVEAANVIDRAMLQTLTLDELRAGRQR